jgi:hypothetical protein
MPMARSAGHQTSPPARIFVRTDFTMDPLLTTVLSNLVSIWQILLNLKNKEKLETVRTDATDGKL